MDVAEETTLVPGRRPTDLTCLANVAIFVVLAVILMGCGGNDPASTPASEPPTATPQPTPGVQMGPVLFTLEITPDGAAVDPSPTIPRSATSIYAVVDVANVQPGGSFLATWTIDGTAIPELDSKATLEDGASSGQIAFHLTWDGAALWPVGVLGVEITASSGETISGAVEIVSS